MPSPLQQFDQTIARSLDSINLAKNLSSTHHKKIHSVIESHDLTELSRYALVLSVSALDCYFIDRFSDALVPFLRQQKSVSTALEQFLIKSGLSVKTTLELLLAPGRPLRKVRTFVEKYLYNSNAQRFATIDALYTVYGIGHFTDHIQSKCKKKDLKKRIQKFIKRRHQIVHASDCNKHKVPMKLDMLYVEGRVNDVATFVHSAEQILASKKI